MNILILFYLNLARLIVETYLELVLVLFAKQTNINMTVTEPSLNYS